MKKPILLLVLFGSACAALALSQSRQQQALAAIAGPTPSPALLDAMSSHGLGTVADSGATADTPVLQPAVYHAGPN